MAERGRRHCSNLDRACLRDHETRLEALKVVHECKKLGTTP